MALRPRARRNPKPTRGAGRAVLSPQKVRALRAFTDWVRALEDEPSARLADFAHAKGLHTRTVWKHVHGTPSVAKTLVEGVTHQAQQGLVQALQRGLRQVEEMPLKPSDLRAWAEFFAKYTHGGFRADGSGSAGGKVEVSVNVGVPAHVRARLGMEDSETKKVDATLKSVEDLVDDG